MSDRERFIEELIGLYKQNVKFLISVDTGACEKEYKAKTILEYEKLNHKLRDYIQDLEQGEPCDKEVAVWCKLFGDILLSDDYEEGGEHLDDDNFPLGGW